MASFAVHLRHQKQRSSQQVCAFVPKVWPKKLWRRRSYNEIFGLARAVWFTTRRPGVGSLDIARGSSSNHAEKAHGDQRGPLDGHFGAT